MTPKQTLQCAMDDLGITVESVFVPWSKSRNFKANAKVTDRSLNWTITIKRGNREILTTDYSAGIGHAPSYASRITLDVEQRLKEETERGKACQIGGFTGHPFLGNEIKIDPCDVVYSLVSDSSVIDYPTFESWASDFGYDSDSRKSEQTYRACLTIALALRAGVGDSGLTKLREACEGY